MHNVYSKDFYKNTTNWAEQSSRKIVPIITDLISPKSVIDIGCGDGTWLQQFQLYGVDTILGLDGYHVSKDIIKIKPEEFIACDLEDPPLIEKLFDLALCLEVAEHLDENISKRFIAFLTELSDIIVFSAAIPMQLGTHHINSQWQNYWQLIFEHHGYLPIITMRTKVWNDPDVAYFYKQNIAIYVKEEKLFISPKLLDEYEASKKIPMSVVHPENYLKVIQSLRSKNAVGWKSYVAKARRSLAKSKNSIINGLKQW